MASPSSPAHCCPKSKMPFLNLSDHDFKPPRSSLMTGRLYRLQLLPHVSKELSGPAHQCNAETENPGTRASSLPSSFPHSPSEGLGKDSSDGSLWENWAWRALSGLTSCPCYSLPCAELSQAGSGPPYPQGGLQESTSTPASTLDPTPKPGLPNSCICNDGGFLPNLCLSPHLSLPSSPFFPFTNPEYEQGGSGMLFTGPFQAPTLNLEIWRRIWFLLPPHFSQLLDH